MRTPSLLSFVVPLILLAGCATPESRLASGLRSAGMGPRPAACLADEMADDLTLSQLMKLSKLGNFKDRSIRDMSMTEFLKATRALQDGEILRIASKAALVCAIKS